VPADRRRVCGAVAFPRCFSLKIVPQSVIQMGSTELNWRPFFWLGLMPIPTSGTCILPRSQGSHLRLLGHAEPRRQQPRDDEQLRRLTPSPVGRSRMFRNRSKSSGKDGLIIKLELGEN